MTTWPFAHQWATDYTVTLSYKTDVLVSRSGQEQRRALRYEPRRTIGTAVAADTATARNLERFTWATKTATFNHIDPVDGTTRLVRLPSTQTVDHKTSGISETTLDLAVEPGSETFAAPVLDAGHSYKGRYVLPFRVNWRDGVSDSLLFPDEVVDYDRGVIAVATPIPFGTKTGSLSAFVEDTSIADFFRAMRGRQGDFWSASPLDDIVVTGIAGTTLTIEGDVSAMLAADPVHTALLIETVSGRYHRSIAAVGVGTITLDADIPDTGPVRRCAWLYLARFASDDYVITWHTNKLGETQVQVQTLPYTNPEQPLVFDEGSQYVVDYYGLSNYPADARDYRANVQMARIGGAAFLEERFLDGRDFVVNKQMPRLGGL